MRHTASANSSSEVEPCAQGLALHAWVWRIFVRGKWPDALPAWPFPVRAVKDLSVQNSAEKRR